MTHALGNRIAAQRKSQVTCTATQCAPCIGRSPYGVRSQQWPCQCAFAAMKETRMLTTADCPNVSRAAMHLARMTAPTRERAKEWEVILTRLAMAESRDVAAMTEFTNTVKALDAAPSLWQKCIVACRALCGAFRPRQKARP